MAEAKPGIDSINSTNYKFIDTPHVSFGHRLFSIKVVVHHSMCMEREALTLVQKPAVKPGREYSIIILYNILSLK